jgi:hypothetical protein
VSGEGRERGGGRDGGGGVFRERVVTGKPSKKGVRNYRRYCVNCKLRMLSNIILKGAL